MSNASKLRELLRQDGMITAPGAYDCITARDDRPGRIQCGLYDWRGNGGVARAIPITGS